MVHILFFPLELAPPFNLFIAIREARWQADGAKITEHTGRDECEANGLLDGAASVSTACLTAIECSEDI